MAVSPFAKPEIGNASASPSSLFDSPVLLATPSVVVKQGASSSSFSSSGCVSPPDVQAVPRPLTDHTEINRWKYEERKTIFERFPDVPNPGGLIMLKRVVDVYGIRGKKGIQHPWFCPDTGLKAFETHPDNDRPAEVAIEYYSD